MIGCRRVPSPCRSGWTRVPGEERVSGSFRDADRPGVAGTAEPQSVGGQDLQVFVIQPVRTAEPLDLAPRAGHHRGKRPTPGRSRRCEVDRAARRRCGARRHLPRCRHRRVPSRLPVRRNGHLTAHPPRGSRARPYYSAARHRDLGSEGGWEGGQPDLGLAAPAAGGDGGHHHGRGTGSRGKWGPLYPAMASVFRLPCRCSGTYPPSPAVSQIHAHSKFQASGNAETPASQQRDRTTISGPSPPGPDISRHPHRAAVRAHIEGRGR